MDFRASFHGKRVFLTGHTGFKGAWLAEWLLHMGAQVTGFSKDIPTRPSLFEALSLSRRLNDLRGDIRDLPALTRALAEAKPDVVFHLAAQPLVRLSYDQPVQTFAENTLGTAHLMEALRVYGEARAAVIITTDKVYENKSWEFGYRETDALGGHDPYSASKAAAEIVYSSYVRSFFQTGTRICSARAGNVIGGGDWALDRLVPDCIRAWIKNQPVELRNPSHTRPWEHVLEPLGGYLLLAQRLLEDPSGVHGEAFNFGPSGDVNRTTLALVEEMEKHWPGARHEVSGPQATAKKEASMLHLNCDRAFQRLGWQPTLHFPETAAWTAEWYRAYAGGTEDLAALTLAQIQRFEAKLADAR